MMIYKDMIHENSPVTNAFVSVPADMGQLNCAAFIAGIVAGALESTKFVSLNSPVTYIIYSIDLLHWFTNVILFVLCSIFSSECQGDRTFGITGRRTRSNHLPGQVLARSNDPGETFRVDWHIQRRIGPSFCIVLSYFNSLVYICVVEHLNYIILIN